MLYNGLEVAVSYSDSKSSTPEYAIRHSEQSNQEKSAFIVTQAGKGFRITVWDSSPFSKGYNAIWVKAFADGRELASVGIRRWQKLRLDHAKDQYGNFRWLVFAEPSWVGADDVDPNVNIDDVSVLEIVIYKARDASTTSYGVYGDIYPVNDTCFSPLKEVSERSAGEQGLECHTVGFGAIFSKESMSKVHAVDPDRRCEPLSGGLNTTNCLARFRFHMRSTDRIQAEGFNASLTQPTINAKIVKSITEMFKNSVLPPLIETPATKENDITDGYIAPGMLRISDLLAEARILANGLEYPSKPRFLPSGILNPKYAPNGSLFDYKVALRAYALTVARMQDDDNTLQQHQRAAIRELVHSYRVCEDWIRASSNVFLSRIRESSVTVTNARTPPADVAVETVPVRSNVTSITKWFNGDQTRKRNDVELEATIEQPGDENHVKPLIKSDPEPPARPMDEGPSMKVRLLQARRDVQEAELAVQQKKLELSLSTLALLEEENREAKRRKA